MCGRILRVTTTSCLLMFLIFTVLLSFLRLSDIDTPVSVLLYLVFSFPRANRHSRWCRSCGETRQLMQAWVRQRLNHLLHADHWGPIVFSTHQEIRTIEGAGWVDQVPLVRWIHHPLAPSPGCELSKSEAKQPGHQSEKNAEVFSVSGDKDAANIAADRDDSRNKCRRIQHQPALSWRYFR